MIEPSVLNNRKMSWGNSEELSKIFVIEMNLISRVTLTFKIFQTLIT